MRGQTARGADGMPRVQTVDATGAPTGALDLPEAIFGQRLHRSVLHRAAVAEMANRRAGTHATRTRGEVRGGGRKPWRQKGTGRARAGSRRSPLWRGGGITFGPQMRSHAQKLSRQERALALRAALSAQARVGRLVVVEPGAADLAKTKAVATLLQAVGRGGPAVMITAEDERVLARAARNVRGARVLSARRLTIRHLLIPGTVLITRPALATLEEVLAP